jgi:leucyl aminopeptidase
MSHRTKSTAWQAPGATGFGVRLLARLVENWQ